MSEGANTTELKELLRWCVERMKSFSCDYCSCWELEEYEDGEDALFERIRYPNDMPAREEAKKTKARILEVISE